MGLWNTLAKIDRVLYSQRAERFAAIGLVVLVPVTLWYVVREIPRQWRDLQELPSTLKEMARDVEQSSHRASFKEISKTPSPSGRMEAVVMYQERSVQISEGGRPGFGVVPKTIVELRYPGNTGAIRSYEITDLRTLDRIIFTGNGRFLAMTGEGGLIVEDIPTGTRKIETLHRENGGALISYQHEWSTDGRVLTLQEDSGKVSRWRTADWTMLP